MKYYCVIILNTRIYISLINSDNNSITFFTYCVSLKLNLLYPCSQWLTEDFSNYIDYWTHRWNLHLLPLIDGQLLAIRYAIDFTWLLTPRHSPGACNSRTPSLVHRIAVAAKASFFLTPPCKPGACAHPTVHAWCLRSPHSARLVPAPTQPWISGDSPTPPCMPGGCAHPTVHSHPPHWVWVRCNEQRMQMISCPLVCNVYIERQSYRKWRPVQITFCNWV